MDRIGIFGGTFDPIHNGHIAAAVAARAALSLDQVLMVVAGDPWQKADAVHASAQDRLDLVTAAVGDIEGLEASAIECERPGPTYTVDTLEALQRPGRELFLILGADAAARLNTWHEPDRVRALATLVVVDRDHDLEAGEGMERVAMPRLDISSTDIRARVAAGRPIDGLVPPAVVRRIAAHGLYTGSQW